MADSTCFGPALMLMAVSCDICQSGDEPQVVAEHADNVLDVIPSAPALVR